MLRRIELEVLVTVDRGDTISKLATKLDHSESYLSRAVADLVEKGVEFHRELGDRVAAVDRGEDLEFDTPEHGVT